GNGRSFREYEMIDGFGGVAESETDAGTEGTFGDTPDAGRSLRLALRMADSPRGISEHLLA
ncbi:MAG: hypothetical protein II341_00225, partial [Oscillospiraceae bacterium]|nr:hypothetical protein [Oscillospiraceae bacterium]